jgi:hypothetical protein
MAPLLPHGAVLDRADVVVCSGTTAVVVAAMARCVPIVAVPGGGEQPDVAALVVRAGVGVSIAAGEADAVAFGCGIARAVEMDRQPHRALVDAFGRNRWAGRSGRSDRAAMVREGHVEVIMGADFLRARLLASLGLVVSSEPACSGFRPFADCDDEVFRGTFSLDAVAEKGPPDSGADTGAAAPLEHCPTDVAEVSNLLYANDEYCNVDTADLISEVGRDCTYDYTCWTCCGYVRPYLDERGAPVESGHEALGRWIRDRRAPMTSLYARRTASGGRVLARETLVRSTRRWQGSTAYALDLLAHGAPRS